MDKILIFGHKKPDTDSVTAAISLSYLKKQQGLNTEARVLGRLNNETKFVLNYFNVKYPAYLNDVKNQIRDVNYIKVKINKSTSIKECYDILNKNKISGAPIVDNKNKLSGIVTLNDITSYLVLGNYTKLNTSYSNILKCLDGRQILKFDNEINGNIMVASYKSTTFITDVELNSDTILIVGDRHSILEYAVNSKVKMIILSGDKHIKEEHLNIAKANKVNIIMTNLDTFHVTKMINLSNYIDDIIITKNPIKFEETSYVSDFVESSRQAKHTNYPVVDKKNNCLGLIRLVDVNDKNRKKVILVDHNELIQSVDGLDETDIIEVIDHHKLGTVKTSYPINFRNMAVGSTNTIIHKIYEENNIPIPRDIAGVMLSGIISDTLLLKSPTTTQFDKQAVLRLSKILNLDYEKYGIEMFKAGSSIKGKSLQEVLFTDFKVFKVGNIEAGIGQIFTTDYNSLKLNMNDMVEVLNQVSHNNDYVLVAFFITDVMRNGSYVIFNDKAREILQDSFNLNELYQGMYLEDVVSRKKQIIPPIIDVLDRN